jgi:hypothetical protein
MVETNVLLTLVDGCIFGFYKQVVTSGSIIVLFRSFWVESYSPSRERKKACTDGDLKPALPPLCIRH